MNNVLPTLLTRISYFLLFLCLSACSTMQSPASTSSSIKQASRAIFSQYGVSTLFFVEIPIPGNIIANAIMVAVLKSSCPSVSNTVASLNTLLALKAPVHIYPHSRDNGIYMATLNCVFSSARVGARHVIYIDESLVPLPQLQTQGEQIGIEIRTLKL